MNLGAYQFPRPARGMFAENYPWLVAEPGDWFEVIADDLHRAENSIRACRWAFARMVDWAPMFSIERTVGKLVVRRVA